MIEIRELGKEHAITAQIVIDGYVIKDIQVEPIFIAQLGLDPRQQKLLSLPTHYRVYIHEKKGIDKLLTQSVSDIPWELDTISFDIPPIVDVERYDFEDGDEEEERKPEVKIYRDDDHQVFMELYILRPSDIHQVLYATDGYSYLSEIVKQIRSQPSLNTLKLISSIDPIQERVNLQASIPLYKPSSIGEQLGSYKSQIAERYDEAVKILLEPRQESVQVLLDFPEELRVYCEQYLVYFVQFLKDLGVEATSELKHKAGKVLFSVTPEDKNEALDKIRVALETYLALPGSELTYSGENLIEVQRLTANIHHLQGQLAITQAVLQAKEATIQAQQISINRLLTENVIDITPVKKDVDREEFLGGTVALTKFKKEGFEINLPEVFRKLKRLFQDKE